VDINDQLLSPLLFNALSQTSPDNIYILQVKENKFYLHWANNSMERAGGVVLDDIQGKTPREVMGDAGLRVEKNYRECVKTQAPLNYEEQAVDADGKPLYWHTLLVPVISTQGEVEYIIGQSRNITTIKTLEKASFEANECKAKLLANVGHELGSQLNTMKGAITALEEKGLSAEQSELLSTLNKSTNLVNRFVQDIFDYAKLDIGKLSIYSSPFDFEDVIRDIEQSATTSSRKLQLDFELVCKGGPLGVLYGDAGRLQQVLNNLLDNAFKYTPEGGKVTLDISYQIESDRVETTFIIRDTGIGISQENLDGLFLPFSRVSEHNHTAGSGLGLSITRNLVELLGGSISVSSELGKGSEFKVVLPLKSTVTKQTQVMYVREDSEFSRNLGRVFYAYDFATLIAENGKSAISYHHHSFDLIVLAADLPDLDACTLIKTMRALNITAPIFVLTTANILPETRQALMDAGANECIAQSVDCEHIVQRVSKWIS